MAADDAGPAVVRPARADDREAIVALIAAMGGHDDVRDSEEPLSMLPALLDAAEGRVLVAVIGERVVGVAALEARTSPLYDRREAWLGMLAVAPDLRSQAIGSLLLDAVDAEAALMGCAAVVLETSLSRHRAAAFYASAGFSEGAPAKRFERPVRDRGGTLGERFLAAAARAATRVAAAVAGRRDVPAVGMGADGAPTEAADAAAERAALGELEPLGVPIVSEESGLIGASEIDPGNPWISLDPLDGSRNFVNGYPAYAMSIGLVRDGRPLAGFVADLAGGSRWYAQAGGPALRNGRLVTTRRSDLAVVPSGDAAAVRRRLAGIVRVRSSGSSAGDLCRVADGSVAVFAALDRSVVHVHDLAAALVILEAAGGCALDRTGAVPLLTPDPARRINLVAACDRETALALVRSE